MKFSIIVIIILLEIVYVMSCISSEEKYSRGMTCCEPRLDTNCCCFDDNGKYVIINYPGSSQTKNFKDIKRLECFGCTFGVPC